MPAVVILLIKLRQRNRNILIRIILTNLVISMRVNGFKFILVLLIIMQFSASINTDYIALDKILKLTTLKGECSLILY